MAEENVNTTLYVCRTGENEDLALGGESGALKAFSEGFGNNLPDARALLYGPKHCFLATLENGAVHGRDGKEIDLEKEAIYEARVFNMTAELRWLNRADGKG